MENMKIYTFDIETIGDELILDRIGVYSEGVEKIFKTYDAFLDFIYYNKINNLYAFYGGGFDFLLILKQFKKYNAFKLLHIIEINGIIVRVMCNYYDHIFTLTDAWFLCYCSLDYAAQKLLGERKIELDRTRLQDYEESKVNDYVLKDCELLYKIIMKYYHYFGYLELTLSRYALIEFERKFCPVNLKKFYRYKKDYFDFTKNYYFGGHVDVYKRYGQNVKCYDIISMYGYVMKEFGGVLGYCGRCDGVFDSDNFKTIHKVIIYSDLYCPIIPYRHIDGKTYYANTRQELYVTCYDIRLMEKLGLKFKILESYLFKFYKHFFSSYIDYWFHVKQSPDSAIQFIAKRMINALYGKFGQNIERQKLYVAKDHEKLENFDYVYDYDLRIVKKHEMNINYFSRPEIALFVTSGARYVHNQLIQKYQDYIYYVDTDSLFLDGDVSVDEIGDDIGKLKVEYDNIKEAYFLGNKFYGLFFGNNEKVVKIKGFTDHSFDKSNFENALYDTWDFKESKNKILRFKQAKRAKQDKDFIKVKHTEKIISNSNIKRKLIDRVNTIPFFIKNNELT